MFRWLDGPGAAFRDPLPGSTNYLNAYNRDGRLIRANVVAPGVSKADQEKGASLPGEEEDESRSRENNIAGERSIPRETLEDLVPFPMNRQFRSQAVLSEELKDEVWHRIVELGKSVRVVSAELGIEMRRVGAVIRLKTVEKQWVEQGKRLANTYATAITAMLPRTPFDQGLPPHIHESINDLPVHKATLTQIFHPVSESRHFTRVDAGKVFSSTLLPADDRVPHPELIEIERARLAGGNKEDILQGAREKMLAEVKHREERERLLAEREARTVKKVASTGGRFEFRFRDVSVEDVGVDGKSMRGVGARYGIPPQDRKRGQIKIPRRVD